MSRDWCFLSSLSEYAVENAWEHHLLLLEEDHVFTRPSSAETVAWDNRYLHI